MATGSLKGKVSIVTGATRGIGKGIAIRLALEGSKVYITGRTLDVTEGRIGSLRETEREIVSSGGICVVIQCDHSDDSQTLQLFEQVKSENNGQLDILVNNAYTGNNSILKELGTPFWEQSLSMWDDVNESGLRNTYLCSVYGTRLMIKRNSGLIVNISSSGGGGYMFNPVYGIGKVGVDRMAADCALELRKHNVTFVSLWPGPVCSDSVMSGFQETEKHGGDVKELISVFGRAETPDFIGKCTTALATDPKIMEKSGQILATVKLSEEYGITDQEGHSPITGDKETIKKFVCGHLL